MPPTLAWLLIAAAALALAAIVAARPWRSRRPAGPTRPAPGRPPAPAPAKVDPRAGEIWWADVPYHGADGSKVRPCLVLRRRRNTAVVLKITSQDHRDRGDHVAIDTSGWARNGHRRSYLDLSDPYTISTSAFRERVGEADAATWRLVRGLHTTG